MAVQTERSFAELLQDIAANVQEIIRSEFRLAKAEVREEAVDAVSSQKPECVRDPGLGGAPTVTSKVWTLDAFWATS